VTFYWSKVTNFHMENNDESKLNYDIFIALSNQSDLKIGQKLFAIDKRWAKKLELSSIQNLPFASPISNNRLIQNGEIRKELLKDEDFLLIPSDAWSMIVSEYGGGPEVSVEVYYNPMTKMPCAEPFLTKFVIIYDGRSISFSMSYFNKYYDLKCLISRKINLSMESFSLRNNQNNCTVSDDDVIYIHNKSLYQTYTVVIEKQKQEKYIASTRMNDGKYVSIYVKGLCGFINNGNTCFFNSIMQCLLQTEPLIDFFLDSSYSRIKITNVTYQKRIQKFSELINDVWKREIHRTDLVRLQNFFQITRRESQYSQEDSHELFITVLEKLHESLIEGNNSPINIDFSDQKNEVESAELFINRHKASQDSIITRIYNSIVKKDIECPNCKSVSFSFESASNLFVTIPQSSSESNSAQKYRNTAFGSMPSVYETQKNKVSLDDCLKTFPKEEIAEGVTWRCPKCNQLVKPIKTQSIWKAPTVLVIVIQRFEIVGNAVMKKCDEVTVPLTLDISNLISTKSGEKNTQYALFGVSQHLGFSIIGGHYVTDVMHRKNENWYRINDDIIEESRKDFHNSYILFYKQL